MKKKNSKTDENEEKKKLRNNKIHGMTISETLKIIELHQIEGEIRDRRKGRLDVK